MCRVVHFVSTHPVAYNINSCIQITLLHMPSTFYCDCERYCAGKRKQVSRTTFYFHKRMRDPLSQFSAPMQTFLKDKPVIVRTPPSNTNTSRGPRKPGNSPTASNLNTSFLNQYDDFAGEAPSNRDSREDVQDQSHLSDHVGPLEHADDSGDSQLLFSPEEYRPDTVGTTRVPSCDTLSGNQPEVAFCSPGPTADSDGFLPGGDVKDL